MFKKLKESERIDLLEYLSFQTRTGMSFRSALERYIESKRSKNIINAVSAVIEAITLGEKPADALLEASIISSVEYTLISNANNPAIAIGTVVGLSKTQKKSADALKNSLRSGILMLSGLLLLIPYFRSDIEQLYMMFAQMAVLSKGGVAHPDIPFLVKYWWSSFVAIGMIGAIYLMIAEVLKYMYRNHGALYYRAFGYTVYKDLVSILSALRQMGQAMTWSQAYATLSESAPNSYWNGLFGEITENLRQGGKISDVVAHQSGIIPVEVVHCFIDGEETGEEDTYLQKAVELCQERYDKAQEQIKIAVPFFFELLLYFLVGLVAVKFTEDMNNLGIMQVLSGIK